MNAVRTRPFACSLLGPFFGSTRAASILPSRPPNRAAVARRACQGWPRLRGHPKGAALTGPSTAARFIGWGWRPPESAWAPRARRPFSPPPRRQIQQRHTSANMPAGNARKIIEKFKPLILVEVHTAANKRHEPALKRRAQAHGRARAPQLGLRSGRASTAPWSRLSHVRTAGGGCLRAGSTLRSRSLRQPRRSTSPTPAASCD